MGLKRCGKKKGGYIGKNERGKSWQRGGGARDSENERVCVRMGLTEKNTNTGKTRLKRKKKKKTTFRGMTR